MEQLAGDWTVLSTLGIERLLFAQCLEWLVSGEVKHSHDPSQCRHVGEGALWR